MAEGKLRDGFTWRLNDPGMGLLERAGLLALYMSLQAAEELGSRDALAPLAWNVGDLTPDSVTIRSDGTDSDALTKLFEWSWQVRDHVLYFPALHRDLRVTENSYYRIPTHTGIMGTFLQHPNTQPKLETETQVVSVEEDKQLVFRFEPPAERVDDPSRPLNPKTKRLHKKKVATTLVRPVEEVSKLCDRKGALRSDDVTLSNWVYPGIAGRYGNEGSWEGPADRTLLVMLAPIACLYLKLTKQRSTWFVVVPDVRDLEWFDSALSSAEFLLDPSFCDVASLSDAGLKCLAGLSSKRVRQELEVGCRVIAMGRVGYYPNQTIRKGVVDVPHNAKILKRYRLLQGIMGNRWMRPKVADDGKEQNSEEVPRKKAKRKKAKPKKAEEPQASHFVSVPSGRGRIADNLINGAPWYASLAEPLPWDRDSLDRLRKTRPGTSIERLWFQNLCYQRGKLMDLIQEDDMWDSPGERLFVEAFWEILGMLYIRERKAVERGGTRKYEQRCEDLNEEVRRTLTRSKTGPLLREAISDLMTRPFETYRAGADDSPPTRSKAVCANPAVIWRLIDRDWKRGRDLALLALASYQSKEKRAASTSDDHKTTATN